jgi:hypothetical protein
VFTSNYEMAVFDTGPIDNRDAPRSLVSRLSPSIFLHILPIYVQTQRFPLGCKKGDRVGFGWLRLLLLLIFLLHAT